MSLFSKIFGAKKKQVSADQFSLILLAAASNVAFEGQHSVRGLFAQAGLNVRAVRFHIEALTFAAAPADILIATELGPRAQSVGMALRFRLVDSLRHMLEPHTKGAMDFSLLPGAIAERLYDYAGVIRDFEGGNAMMKLSRMAYENITGNSEADAMVMTQLATIYGISTNMMREMFSQYEIVN